MMDFEWDDAKANANMLKHGVTFAMARLVFNDVWALDMEDRTRDYGEERRIVIGMIRDTVFTVVYGERNDVTRLISARKSTRHERLEYARQRANI